MNCLIHVIVGLEARKRQRPFEISLTSEAAGAVIGQMSKGEPGRG
jgi:hypothetical protein